MSNYMVVFIVDGLRKFEPALEIGDERITYITELSADGREELKGEIGEDLFKKLWRDSVLSCIQIHVNADDETSAIEKAWINGKQVTDALSLVEFDKKDAISFAYKRSPNILPNVLIANMDEDSHSLEFRHYTPPGLVQLNLGGSGVKAKDFNENIIRHIESLMPAVIWRNREFENELVKRLVHSLHWHATAMNQQEREFRFIAIWFALESLVIESIQVPHKKRKIANRLPKLFAKHNAGEINQSDIEELWELRNNIVHEARSGFMGDSNYLISATHMNLVKYFYLLAVLFTLDELEGSTSVSQIWRKLKDYIPSVNIEYENMPAYLDYTGLFMSYQ